MKKTKELTCPLCGATGLSPKHHFDFDYFPCLTSNYWSRNILLQSRLCYRTQHGITTPPMKFELRQLHIRNSKVETFTELDAPEWLTAERTIPGSTGDGRWFWDEHVLTLKIGESIDTDFSKITRIE